MAESAARYICFQCETEWGVHPGGRACPGCLESGTVIPLPFKVRGRKVDTAPRRRGGLRRAADLDATQEGAPYGAPFSSWKIGTPHGVLVYGPPGSGKSTLLSRMAVSAARKIEVLYVASEEGHGATVRERLNRAGLDDLSGRRLVVSDARTFAEFAEDADRVKKDALIVIDSQTELRASVEALVERIDGRSWLMSQHVTTSGQPRGGLDGAHRADAVVRLKDGDAIPDKNRWGVMDSIAVWKNTAETLQVETNGET